MAEPPNHPTTPGTPSKRPTYPGRVAIPSITVSWRIRPLYDGFLTPVLPFLLCTLTDDANCPGMVLNQKDHSPCSAVALAESLSVLTHLW